MLPSQSWFLSSVTVFHFSLLNQPSFAIQQCPELRTIGSEAMIWRDTNTNYSYIKLKNTKPLSLWFSPQVKNSICSCIGWFMYHFQVIFLHPWVLVSFQIKSQASCYQTFSWAVSVNSSRWHALKHCVNAPGSKAVSSKLSSSQLWTAPLAICTHAVELWHFSALQVLFGQRWGVQCKPSMNAHSGNTVRRGSFTGATIAKWEEKQSWISHLEALMVLDSPGSNMR